MKFELKMAMEKALEGGEGPGRECAKSIQVNRHTAPLAVAHVCLHENGSHSRRWFSLAGSRLVAEARLRSGERHTQKLCRLGISNYLLSSRGQLDLVHIQIILAGARSYQRDLLH